MYRIITRAVVPFCALAILGSVIAAIYTFDASIVTFVPFGVLAACLVLPFALCGVDAVFKTRVSCDTFGWHNGSGGTRSFDGCSVHAVCSKCGKEVMQDSQGNWF